MRPSLSRAARLALPAVALAGAAAPAAHADATVAVRVSTHYAIGGLPLSATVTSPVAGTLYLSQSRADELTSLKGEYCGHPQPEILRDVTSFHVAANAPVKVGINASRLSFFDGELFATSSCWDKATQFKELVASVQPDAGAAQPVPGRTALQRVL